MESLTVKERVRRILELPEALNEYWDVIDTLKENDQVVLAMAHYIEEKYKPDIRRMDPLRDIRGIIVHLPSGLIVCRSVGYTKMLPIHAPIQIDDNSIVVRSTVPMYVTDEMDNPDEEPEYVVADMKFDKSSSAIYIGTNTVFCRIFKFGGKVYFSNFKKIDGSNSSWTIGREKFLDAFNRLAGRPNLDTLFGPEANSPYVHLFVINDRCVRLVDSTTENRVYYLGVAKVWEGQTVLGNADTALLKGFDTPTSQEVPEPSPEIKDKPPVYQPRLSVDNANKYLFPAQFATPMPTELLPFHEEKEFFMKIDRSVQNQTRIDDIYYKFPEQEPVDERLQGGEPVIVYTYDSKGGLAVYRFDPLSYQYRASLFDNDPNPYHQFVLGLFPFQKQTWDRDAYPKPTVPLNTVEERERYWHQLFYDAISPEFKPTVQGYLKQYHDDIEMVKNFIRNKYSQLPKEIKDRFFKPPVQNRLGTIYQLFRNNRDKNLDRAISKLVYNENPDNLYKMFSSIKNFQRNGSKVMF